jgi:hypothetical protein
MPLNKGSASSRAPSLHLALPSLDPYLLVAPKPEGEGRHGISVVWLSEQKSKGEEKANRYTRKLNFC